MRLILVWPLPSPEISVLMKELENAGHEIVYWVGYHQTSYLTPKGAVFHDHYDAWDCKRADALKDVPILPASSAFIGRHHDLESVALSMMDKRYGNANVYERKHIYHTMLAYWEYVLERYKPDAVIFATIPHSVYNYVLYELARERGLLTPCFEDTWIASRAILYEDFWKGSETLKHAIEQSKGAKLKDLPDDLQKYYKRFTETEEQPAYMMEQRGVALGMGKILHRLRIALRDLPSGKTFMHVWRFLRDRLSDNLAKEYASLQMSPNITEPYVYFPLHMQPERTTCPQGGVFNDQILIAETVAAALPDGWSLVIKEHPSQWWLREKTRYSSVRFRGFYKQLAAIPRVKLVPTFTNTFTLTKNAKAIVTIMGTAGWEALLRGIPALVFGYPWYRDSAGVANVSNVEECKTALTAVEEGALKPTEHAIFAFLKALDEVGIRAYVDHLIGKDERVSFAESFAAAGKALNDFFRRSRPHLK